MIRVLVLAGGRGRRFWPLSTKTHPKQFLKLYSEKTMIRETIDRILPLIPAEHIYVATNILHLDVIKEELPMIPEENLIVEPAVRDSAAAIGYGCLYIRRDEPNVTVVTLASDHQIEDDDQFRKILRVAIEEAERENVIVTFGIKPIRPETRFGYIKVDGEVKPNEVCNVKSFLEKPNLEVAESYIADGSYLWNSGMFVFKIDTMLNEIEKYMPKHNRVLKNLQYYFDQDLTGTSLARKTKLLFDDFEKVSIDYGVMEKTPNIKVVPVTFGWSDIGSFTSFEDAYEADEAGNVVRHTHFEPVDSNNNIIFTEHMEVKVVGLQNMIVVQSGNKLLICDKYEMDKMKQFDSSEYD